MADILIDMGSSVEGFVVGQETNSDLLQAAWHAMSLAHPLLNTNFRCLQAFVYYTYRTHKGASALKCFGSKNKVHANMRSYSALAIRLAEKLDLHKLSANEQAMPKLPDPAFPSQPSFFARQMGLRLWATVYLVVCVFFPLL